jgi:medium-chain acyl-[acyl-carrier-protein] hydrolase
MPETQRDWLVIRRPRRTPFLRLFCFPFAGGSAMAFKDWDAAFPDTIELVAVQPPSQWARAQRSPPVNLREFAAHLAVVMRPLLDRPYGCFGHSLGSLVSFELVQELRRRHWRLPQHLIMSGRVAPHVHMPPLDWHRMDDGMLIEKLRRLEGAAPALLDNKELMEMFLPLLRTDAQLADGYRPAFSADSMLTCGMSVYNGLSDTAISKENLMEWQKYVAADLRLRWFPGGHFYIHTARAALLQGLLEDLRPFSRGH